MRYYKFVNWDVPEPTPEKYDMKFYKMAIEKHFYCEPDLIRTGSFRNAGYLYDFRDELNRYLVHTEGSGWKEFYCINKTALRKSLQYNGYGKPTEPIIEIKNKLRDW